MSGLAKFTVIPILGWIISAKIAVLIAIPLHFLWGWLQNRKIVESSIGETA